MTVAILLLIQAVVFAVLSGVVASNNNRDATKWSIIGFLFGLFGFIAAIAVGEVEETQPSSRQKSQPSSTQEFDPDEHEKKCPMCAEHIKLEARRCKHCEHELSDEEVRQQIERKKRDVEWSVRERRETRKSNGYDTEDISSTMKDIVMLTHNFNDEEVCRDCGHTEAYVKSNRYICPDR